MTNPLRTPDDYELFVYTLAEQFPTIRRSTVLFVRYGATLARVAGEIAFAQRGAAGSSRRRFTRSERSLVWASFSTTFGAAA